MNKINIPNGLGFRPIRKADKPFLLSLFEQTRDFLYLADQETDYIKTIVEHQQTIQQLSYEQQSPNQMAYIIEKQNTPVGKLTIDFGHNFAHVIDLTIIKEAQGKGYGKSIIKAVQNIAQQQGLPVGLSVEKGNLRTQNFYKSMGFNVFQDLNSHQFLMWYPAKSKEFV